MNRRKTYRVWGPVFAAAVLVLLVFVTGVLDKQRVFEDMEYNQISFKENRRSRSLDAGDRYGLLNEGATGLNLPAGTYRCDTGSTGMEKTGCAFPAATTRRFLPQR